VRIGIDVREFCIDKHTGIRFILENFIAHARIMRKHEFVLFGNQFTDFHSLAGKHKEVILPEKNTILWDQFQLPRALKKEKVDIFYSPYIKTPFLRVCPYVNTICDILPLSIPKHRGLKAFLEKIYFYVYSYLCGRRSVNVVTLSEDARKKVARIFRISPKKLKVVYPPVDIPKEGRKTKEWESKIVDEYDLFRPYFLYLGNFKKHKNLLNLIAAYDVLSDEVKNDYKLMLVGGSPEEVQ